ncbi:MAG: hypothetical protein JWR80_4234 [Bradyrhizobium sp.]|nr:hypothetical protein [Bradyrhizobium sp.]
MHLTEFGDDAEAEAARRLHRAQELHDSGQAVVWTEVGDRLPRIRVERAAKGD